MAARGNSGGERRRAIFAHPADVHCAIFHLVVLACYAAAFWIWLHPGSAGLESAADRVAFVLGAGFLLGWISGVDVGVNFHNHTHRRIFRSAFLNRWFGRLWTFSGGWPAYYWNHAHVVVHHANVLEEKDWTLPRRRPDGRFERVYRYVLLHWPWRYAAHLWRDFRGRRTGRPVGRKALKELAIFLALWSIPFWIDPVMALGLWVVPHWIGNAVTMGSGMYVQHAGGRPRSDGPELAHSNTYLSRFFNLTMFNIGYHVEHHDSPHVHWSELPAFHEEMRERLVEGGAHVLPYGYYRAANLVASITRPEAGFRRFVEDQAPGYEPLPAGSVGEREVLLHPAARTPAARAGLAEAADVG